MITADYLSIETVAHLLVRDRVIVRQLKASFGKAATSIVAALKAQESPDLGDTNSGIYDFLVDALHNKARTYLTFQSDAPDEDMYSIEVMGLGGVYFVHGGEFGQFGYFDSLNAAAAGVDAFWDGVIVWPHPTAPRRRPFGPRCKDAAHPAKRKPTTTRPAARTRAQASKRARLR